ncbi:MAG: precorrin-2 C(20)-methyltransferase [archaeon]|nr:precorrin-2 C(20)-methyltransferase [archaeon]MCP8306521.1 precorrin-2 C(20)-methyltransferase [archaeon]
MGRIIGIGIGPGNPELITIKAAKMLRKADVIFVPKVQRRKPSIALSVIKPVLEERDRPPEILELMLPMTRDKKELEIAWDRNAEIMAEKAKCDKLVAYVVLGDPTLYSTFAYLARKIGEKYPKIDLEIIPGVTSLTACAARSGVFLAEGNEILTIVPSDRDLEQIEEIVRYADNLVFIKGVQRLKGILPILEKVGFTKNSLVIIARRCTMPNEEMKIGRLIDLQSWFASEDYFSMAIIKRKGER